MTRNRISIIAPVYNAEQYLSGCVASILNQSYSDFELILINDGSKDKSLEICQEFERKDDRVKVFNKSNTGVSDTRNFGLTIANGEYVVFIDSDDRIGERFLENYITALKVDNDALVYQGFINVFTNGNVKTQLTNGYFKDDRIMEALYEVEYKQCLGGAWNKIFKRDTIINNNIKFNPEIDYGEDKIFTLEYITKIDSIILSDECEYYYNRLTEGSLSKKHHQSKKLKKFINIEYDFFKILLQKYSNEKFHYAINARYLSFNKYILLSMYRKNDEATKEEKRNLRHEIKFFAQNNKIDINFEREIPRLYDKIITFPLLIISLMFLREKFGTLYHKIFNT